MMTVRQASQLIDGVIVAVIAIGGLFYFFGPVALRTDEVIVIGLIILALIGFQIGLRRSQ
jgi:predicted tellurium resistance membrane protein TerC